MGLGPVTYDLSRQYSEWSAIATVVLASRGENTLSEISQKMGYGRRAVFQLKKTKAPDEQEMYEHQGLAWVVGAQSTIRLYRRCLEARDTPQGLIHKQEVLAQAKNLVDTYVEAKTIIDNRFAATVCSALAFLRNMGMTALNRMQEKL
eukprot:1067227-Karenia_brevis.AAC.1